MAIILTKTSCIDHIALFYKKDKTILVQSIRMVLEKKDHKEILLDVKKIMKTRATIFGLQALTGIYQPMEIIKWETYQANHYGEGLNFPSVWP